MPSRPTLRRSARIAAALTLATTGFALVSATPAVAHDNHHDNRHDNSRVVRPGQSIQAALDAARPGSRIVVKAGTYAEQLTITKSVDLVGRGAVLVPPASPATNTCSGLARLDPTGVDTQAGICITGRDVQLAPFEVEHRKFVSVGRRVRDVSVNGFAVRGFSGANIALVGASHTRLDDNELADGSVYGAVSVGSKHTRISDNTVTNATLGLIGICVDDVKAAVLDDNDVSGQAYGLCIQTQGADVRDNYVHDNCVGVYVDPGIGAYVHDNYISSNNADCSAFAFNGVGIFLYGTNGTHVRDNYIEGHVFAGFGAALVLTDADGGPVATNNVIEHNRFRHNDKDISVTSTGTNVIAHNRCRTSAPTGFCH
jgi:hypothetical protein